MTSRDKHERDPREEYDLDVERMLNEGLAGGYVNPTEDHQQIEQSHDIRKNNQPFSKADDES
ncbi:hypothetical protein ABID56_001627 [Alkalibacillus flavidus]|uniref:DUF4025 domain-containing protein n=1 Tax=Alkalibacillus flavidus TaxID=546021 RepID=A0ABV2KVD5_9BACI